MFAVFTIFMTIGIAVGAILSIICAGLLISRILDFGVSEDTIFHSLIFIIFLGWELAMFFLGR